MGPLSLTRTRRSRPSPTCMRTSLPRPTCMRTSLLSPTSMSRSQLRPTSTRSPSPSLPPSWPPPLLLTTTPLWPPPLWLTTTPLPQLLRLLPPLLPTTMPLLQLLTTTTSDMLPLPTPTLLPRLPKRCHTTFDDEDIQRRYLRQAVINCDKKDFIDIFSLFDHIGL